jgi:hypothetical protein
MTDFSAEQFDDKYEHYFTELQTAYRDAFEHMSERHDSELVHAIDQAVLAESEPFYEGNGRFRVEVPDDAVERVNATGVLVSNDRAAATVEEYAARIETELRSVFGFEDDI